MRVRRRPLPPKTHAMRELGAQDTAGFGFTGGYRGDEGIEFGAWGTPGPEIVCALLCRCSRWWGWVPERVAIPLRASMRTEGCRGCQ